MKSCLKARSIQSDGNSGPSPELQDFGSDKAQCGGLSAAHKMPESSTEVGESYPDFPGELVNATKRARISSCASSMQNISSNNSKRLTWGTMQEFHGQG